MKKIIALTFIALMFGSLAHAGTSDYTAETWQNIELDGNFGPADCAKDN